MNAKTIALTGCSRGLGRALLNEFIAAGHTVHGCARSAEALQALTAEFGSPHSFTALDVTDDAAAAEWVSTIEASSGPDILINNAAIITQPAPLWEVSPEDFRRLVDVNITGVFTVIRHMVPVMQRAGTGIIVNLSSGWGRSVSPGVAPYCASKWAIEGLTQALALELPDGLAAVAMNPGVIDTDMLRDCWGEDAGGYRKPAVWAKTAAPFILGLDLSHNGGAVTAP